MTIKDLQDIQVGTYFYVKQDNVWHKVFMSIHGYGLIFKNDTFTWNCFNIDQIIEDGFDVHSIDEMSLTPQKTKTKNLLALTIGLSIRTDESQSDVSKKLTTAISDACVEIGCSVSEFNVHFIKKTLR